MAGHAFDLAYQRPTRGVVLEYDTGRTTRLPLGRWFGSLDAADAVLVRRCRGATLDVGCGPGRLTAALAQRGVPALGIDTSLTAIRLTRQQGGFAAWQDVFDPVPDEGGWRHVLLADGNIGIGGDPARLLHRIRAVLAPGGSALVEVAAPGTGLRCGRARLAAGPWFAWAEVDQVALTWLSSEIGFGVRWTAEPVGRRLVELTRAPTA